MIALLSPSLWAWFTVFAAAAQTARNAMQRELMATLGTVGATQVRFLFGLPFALGFLFMARVFTGVALPAPSPVAVGEIAFGAVAQIAATALMLAAMQRRSFVVAIAYTKTEALQVAFFGFVFLGEQPSLLAIVAIVLATVGVMLLSWPKAARAPALTDAGALSPALMGIVSGTFFAFSALGYRAGILALGSPSFVINAATSLSIALTIQSALMTLYLAVIDRPTLIAIMRAWRPSLFAGFMGALGSAFWNLAFAIEIPARVRTLGLVEMVFAQIVGWRSFRQKGSPRDYLGVTLIVVGCAMLVNT